MSSYSGYERDSGAVKLVLTPILDTSLHCRTSDSQAQNMS